MQLDLATGLKGLTAAVAIAVIATLLWCFSALGDKAEGVARSRSADATAAANATP